MKECAVNVRAYEGEEPIMLLLQRTFSQGVNCLTLNSFGIRPSCTVIDRFDCLQ